MRTLIPAAALALLAAPAFAQTAAQPAAPAAPAPAPAPPPATAPSQAAPARPTHHAHRQSLKARFDAANTTHDGHLTKDQADAANWAYVSNHFDAMDATHKGYVTVDDIHGYARKAHTTRRAAHHKAPAATSGAAPAAPAAPSGTNE